MTTIFQQKQNVHKKIAMRDKIRSNGKLKGMKDQELHKMVLEKDDSEQVKQTAFDKERVGNTEVEKEAFKEQQKQKILSQSKINELTKQAGRILFKTSTVFPFTLFPTTLIVSENKVDLVDKIFFKSRYVFNIFITDIKHVTISMNLFFGSLHFDIEGIDPSPEPINYLKKHDAIEAKNLILGLIALKKENVSLTPFNIQELIQKAEAIGQTQQV